MSTNSTISHTVMRRIRTIHTLRTALPAGFAAAVVFALSLLAIGREVWVAKVLANMPSVADVPAVTHFYLSAVVHTDLMVQVLLLVAVAALVWLARECARLLSVTTRFV